MSHLGKVQLYEGSPLPGWQERWHAAVRRAQDAVSDLAELQMDLTGNGLIFNEPLELARVERVEQVNADSMMAELNEWEEIVLPSFIQDGSAPTADPDFIGPA